MFKIFVTALGIMGLSISFSFPAGDWWRTVFGFCSMLLIAFIARLTAGELLWGVYDKRSDSYRSTVVLITLILMVFMIAGAYLLKILVFGI